VSGVIDALLGGLIGVALGILFTAWLLR